MKRSKEITIIVDALIANNIITDRQTDKTRSVIKEAIKDIGRERYEEKQIKRPKH